MALTIPGFTADLLTMDDTAPTLELALIDDPARDAAPL